MVHYNVFWLPKQINMYPCIVIDCKEKVVSGRYVPLAATLSHKSLLVLACHAHTEVTQFNGHMWPRTYLYVTVSHYILTMTCLSLSL